MRKAYIVVLLVALALLLASVDASYKGSRCKKRKNTGDRERAAGTDERREGHRNLEGASF